MFISGIKSLKVEWRELRALNGLDLKVYVLVRNYSGQLTCKEIARLLGESHGRVWLSLLRLKERFYVRHDSQGRYEKVQFFVPWRCGRFYGDRSKTVQWLSNGWWRGIFRKFREGIRLKRKDYEKNK